ncbi:unnamed protein product [Periconia digitata]|uniref:Uncharacterized protein n=1 Tax=Periconia digitata TaxID=1303443 RepID=A0A9W4XJ44_9PLEO|nr:unnamed protein product [Periconia digitata]
MVPIHTHVHGPGPAVQPAGSPAHQYSGCRTIIITVLCTCMCLHHYGYLGTDRCYYPPTY